MNAIQPYSNIWGSRWSAFFVVAMAFLILMFVIFREDYVAGRLLYGENQDGCIVASGSYDDGFELLAIPNIQSEQCRSSQAIFAMRVDKRDSLIRMRRGMGPLMCVTDDRTKPYVSMRLCKEEDADAPGMSLQVWHNIFDHLRSDGAARVGLSTQCATIIRANILGTSHRLVMQECRASEWQFIEFVKGTSV
jgi:hypothetical protein